MPIRLNLLAEAQAAAEMRRRDPVKRAIMASVVLIALALGWSGYLYLKSMMANSDLGKIEVQMQTHTNKFQQIQIALDKTDEIKTKLQKLGELSTNRFLNGNLMQALQQTTVDDVQIIRLRMEQAYAYTEGTKRRTNDDRVIPATPAKSTEKTILTLEGIEGKLFRPMALTVIFALAGSMVLSLTLMPVLASFFMRDDQDREPKILAWARRVFDPALERVRRHPWPVVCAAVVLVAVAVVGSSRLCAEFVPQRRPSARGRRQGSGGSRVRSCTLPPEARAHDRARRDSRLRPDGDLDRTRLGGAAPARDGGHRRPGVVHAPDALRPAAVYGLVRRPRMLASEPTPASPA
jgi:hypothetical protein